MKKIANKIMILFLVAFVGTACESDLKYKEYKVTDVPALVLPADDYYLELLGTAGQFFMFQWEPASTENGISPIYEIAFYNAPDGKEITRYDAGSNTNTSIAHKDLNKIMSLAGVDTGMEGDVYWTVIATNGVVQSAGVPAKRKLSAKRLSGFEVIPQSLFVTGSASEEGTVGAPIIMRRIEDGEFEVFTSLDKNGTYNFVDEFGSKITILNDLLEIGETPITVANSGIYRIMLDFNTKGVEFQTVSNIRHLPCWTKSETMLDYLGNGVWGKDNAAPDFTPDDRYFFKLQLNGVASKIGYSGKDDFSSGPPSLDNPAAFKVFVHYGENSDWDYNWKCPASYRGQDSKLVNIRLYMNAEQDYYHKIDYLEL